MEKYTRSNITTNILLHFFNTANNVFAFADHSIFIQLTTINKLISWNYLVQCISRRVQLLNRENNKKIEVSNIKDHSIYTKTQRKRGTCGTDFNPECFSLLLLVSRCLRTSSSLRICPPRAKHFSFLPNPDRTTISPIFVTPELKPLIMKTLLCYKERAEENTHYHSKQMHQQGFS